MARVDAIGMGAMATVDLSVAKTDFVSQSEGVQSFDCFLSNHASDESQNSIREIKNDENRGDSTVVEQPETLSMTKKITDGSEEGLHTGGKQSEDLSEGIKELTQRIREEVKECLNVDDAKLDATLEQLGISLMELLNPNVLQQFVLTLNQAEGTIDFLTNESMLQSFEQLTEIMANLSDEFKDLLAQMEQFAEPALLDEQTMADGMMTTDFGNSSTDVTESVEGTMEQGIAMPKEEQGIVEQKSEEVESTEDTAQTKDIRLDVQEDAATEDTFANEEEQSETMYQSTDAGLFSNTEVTVEEERPMATLFGEQFNHVKDAVGKLFETNVPASQRMQQMIDIVHQVTNHVRNRLDANTTTLEMQLNPASLGKVVLTVASKDGVMTANFRVESEEAKNALESQMAALKETFHEKNLKVESVDVEISEFNFTQSNETKKQMDEELAKESKKRFKFADELEDGMEEKKADEELRRRVMRDSGGSIDYTA